MKNPQIQFSSSSEGWNISSYNEIGENFKYGLSVPAIPFDGENKYLRITDIDDDTRIFDMTNLSSPGTDLSLANEYILTEGDITFARTGASVGKSYLYDAKDGKIYFAGFLIKIGIKKNVCASFIFQNSLTSNFKRYINLVSQRSGQPGINIKELQAYKLYIPKTLEEQQKIASYFKSLDSLIQTTSKKLVSLKQIKDASLQSMFPQEGETVPKVRFKGFEGEWEKIPFGSFLKESYERSTVENEDILLSSAITGVYLNSELFGHQRGASNIGYKKIKKNMLILSTQNLHLGNANVNLRFEHGLISPAYKVYEIVNISPLFLQQWIKMDSTKVFFLNATTAGASLCRKNIVWDDLYKQIVLIPSKNEQVKIGLFFSNLDKQISLQTQRLEKLKQIKAACLEKMFV